MIRPGPRARLARGGAAAVLLAALTAASMARTGESARAAEQEGKLVLSTGRLTTTFDLNSGAWEVGDAAGKVFAGGLRCGVSVGGESSSATGPRRLSQAPVKDAFGSGVRAEIAHEGKQPFVLALTAYDGAEFLLLQIRIPNASGLKVRGATLAEGRLIVGADLKEVCTISNYWSGEWYTEIHPVELTERRPRWETYSHFCLCAYNRADEKSVILGALYGKGNNRVEVKADAARDTNGLAFQARCSYDKNPLTVAEDTWESPPWILCAPRRVFQGLEAYGAVARAHRSQPIWSPPPSGWCSWGAGASDSQKELFANVDAMKANRLDEYGLKYVQLDDGWQQGGRNTTTWRPIPQRFPAGMDGVARYIREKGFEPGLWIAPFSQQDLGRPDFPKWLAGEMKLFVTDWGFHYIKADFLSYPHKFESAAVPYDVAYLKGIQVMSEALKRERGYLMTCINHEWLGVGWSDGQRLGNDVHGGDLTGLYVTLKCWPRRYFTNNSFWVGDPDMLHVNLPTDEQSQVWASFVALSGGAAMSGDSIPKLKPSRLEILKKVYPAQGFTARPCDLFDRPVSWAPKYARIWDCKVRKPGVGAWDVLGLFNWTVTLKRERTEYAGENQNVSVDFARHLGLDAAKRYHVYDYWKQEYLGVFEKGLLVGLPPASCRVLALREESGVPQVLGTDRHILCGTPDLLSVQWDAAKKILSGVSESVKNTPYLLAVHAPPGFSLAAAQAGKAAAQVTKVSEFFHKVTFPTGETGKVEWSLQFAGAAAGREPSADSALGRLEIPKPPRTGNEIPLRQLAPLWTDQRHDIEGRLLTNGASPDLATTAPFWVCWDVSEYVKEYPQLLATCGATGGKDAQVFFEVLGDGKRLHATRTLKSGESEEIKVEVAGVKDLTLVCHYVEGWFSSTQGVVKSPRLTKP